MVSGGYDELGLDVRLERVGGETRVLGLIERPYAWERPTSR